MKIKMRDLTIEDQKHWATTPVDTKLEMQADKHGVQKLTAVWQRFEQGDFTIEVIEGVRYVLSRLSAHSLRLVGVEDRQ